MSTTTFVLRSQAAAIALAFTASVVFAPVALACTDSNNKQDNREKSNNGLALAKGNEKHSDVRIKKPKEQPVVPTVSQKHETDTVKVQSKERVKTQSTGQMLSTSTTIPSSQTPTTQPNPTGNNGTLKVHEYGTKSAFINNDPKVCSFNFEGFGFDVGQDGYIIIRGQGQTKGQYGPYSFGPTVADAKHRSYAETLYFNVDGGPTVVNGHYKATLYGKDTGGNVNLKDEKAKSKVFKVMCESNVPVTPETPTVPVDPSVPIVEAANQVLSSTTAGAQTPATLPSTGSEVVVMAAIAAAIAGFVGFVSYVLRYSYLKIS